VSDLSWRSLPGSLPLICRHERSDTPAPARRRHWAAVVERLGLSPQQARIVEVILSGSATSRSRQKLGLAVPTVRTYLGRIFQRLGVEDRVELVVRVFVTARELTNGRRMSSPLMSSQTVSSQMTSGQARAARYSPSTIGGDPTDGSVGASLSPKDGHP